MNLLTHIPIAPDDAIFGFVTKFKQDPHPDKVNVVVGAYRTAEGKPYVLRVVRKVEEKLANEKIYNKEYLPIAGDEEFRKASAALLFGKDSDAIKEGRVATVQAISGTGSLRIAADFLKKFFPDSSVYLSDPTWGNHRKIFGAAGLSIQHYRYFFSDTNMLDFQGLMEDLKEAPRRSIVLLHACAHNPTGVDPSQEEWKEIASLCVEKEFICLFDCAYQGYATGDLDRDAFAVRYFTSLKSLLVLTAQSYSKNLGLYCERAGALSVVTNSSEEATACVSQLKLIIRPMYSNPPAHGARIVSTVLNCPTLYHEWEVELKEMSERIKQMRTELYSCIEKNGTPGDWTHILKQIGMFTYTGLSTSQVQKITEKHHIYMLPNGRISMAGLCSATCLPMANAIHDVVVNSP